MKVLELLIWKRVGRVDKIGEVEAVENLEGLMSSHGFSPAFIRSKRAHETRMITT